MKKVIIIIITSIIFILFLIIFITSGCEELEDFINNIVPIEKIDICLDVTKEGSGDLNIKILFKEGKLDFKDDALEKMEKEASDRKFEVKPYSSGNLNGITASTSLDLIGENRTSNDSDKEILDIFEGSFLNSPLTVEKNFFSTEYKFSTHMGPVFISENRFILDLPGKYQEHNADMIEGSRLIWDLNGYRDIQAHSRSINTIPIIIIIIGSVVILLLVIILITRVRRSV